jgi:hypothetical protein
MNTINVDTGGKYHNDQNYILELIMKKVIQQYFAELINSNHSKSIDNFNLNDYKPYLPIFNLPIQEAQLSSKFIPESSDSRLKTMIIKAESNLFNDKSYMSIFNLLIQEAQLSSKFIPESSDSIPREPISKSLELYKFYIQIFNSLTNDDFEYGKSSKTEIILKKLLEDNNNLAKEAIQYLWVKNYSDKNILCALLRTISHFDYYELSPQNMLFTTSAIAHKDEEVIECAIRCCENWDNNEVLDILKNVKCHVDWMNNYLNEVIMNIGGKFV